MFHVKLCTGQTEAELLQQVLYVPRFVASRHRVQAVTEGLDLPNPTKGPVIAPMLECKCGEEFAYFIDHADHVADLVATTQGLLLNGVFRLTSDALAVADTTKAIEQGRVYA